MANTISNYVKFRRGNSEAFKKLTKKESDTLYFIYEEDASKGELYLGEKLISGGGEGQIASSLRELSDTLIDSNLDVDSFLVFDIAQNKWVDKPVEDILSVFVGTAGDRPGITGLVPAPGVGEGNYFLRGDGTWSEVVAASAVKVYQTVVGSDEEHADAISRVLTADPSDGDIVVLKDFIAEGKYQHTSYVFNGRGWVAMDGNYNAENVYFDEDFIFTNSIGAVEVPENGNIKISATGKNLKTFLNELFAKEKDPEVVSDVSASLVLKSPKEVEVGFEYEPSYQITFSKGKYSYGPDTNIIATYNVRDTEGNESDLASGKLEKFIVSDSTEYSIIANIDYSEGAVPLSNLGNPVESKRIPAGTITLQSETIKGYRNAFYGTLAEKGELNSSIIRELNKTNHAIQKDSVLYLNIPVGIKRVVIAYDASIPDLSSVLDKNDSDANIVSGFKESIIQVEGADGHEAIDYKVYVLDFAIPYDAANIYTITI